ncbi:MAG: indole-3-glycerol phosphate synthase TrpC [Vulcanimicrobiaceae bacterium]
MNDILERIFAAKARVLARDQAAQPYDEVQTRALARVAERRPFARTLRESTVPAIIGEIKRASPSVGLISKNFEPVAIARQYDRAGVEAMSVITESDHFLGELAFLDLVRPHTSRPLLRKDFICTPYEVAQSAAYGADAVLLIVAALTDEALALCLEESRAYKLDVLVEVHDENELSRAVALNATLVGINNRNLRTFETDLTTSEYLIPKVPAGVTIISESGMRDGDDIRRLVSAGAHGFLIGEALMRSGNPGDLIARLKAAGSRSAAF